MIFEQTFVEISLKCKTFLMSTEFSACFITVIYSKMGINVRRKHVIYEF